MATRKLVTYALVVTAVLVVSFLRDAGALQEPLALGALTPGDAAPLALDLLLVWGFAVLAIWSGLFEVGDAVEERSRRAGARSPRVAPAPRCSPGAGRP